MTEKDKELIRKAWKTHYTLWYMVEAMIEEADTPEAKEKLRTISCHKYHMEEASAGCI